MLSRQLQLFSVMLVCGLVGACATGGTESLETPLLDRLLGEPLSDLPGGPEVRLHAARADRALAGARHAEAMVELGKAVEALPEGLDPCGVRGGLQYLHGLAAQRGSDNAGDHGWDDLMQECILGSASTSDARGRLFFSYMTADEAADSAGLRAMLDNLGDNQPVSTGARRGLELEQAAKTVGGPRGEVLFALAAFERIRLEVQEDPCDQAYEERHREALAAAFDGLDSLARGDLALGFWPLVLVDPDGRMVPGAVDGFRAWLEKPENRWVRTDALVTALTSLRLQADWVDPVLSAPLCDSLFDDLDAQVNADKYAERNYRNSFLLMDSFRSAGACVHDLRVSALTDLILEQSLKGPKGAVGTLEVLGSMLLVTFLEIMEGRADTSVFVMGELARGTERVRGKLSDSAEDRALDAVLRIVEAGPALIQGDFRYPLLPMEQAVITFDELAAQPAGPDAPDMVRLVPGLRAGTLGLMAVLQFVTDSREDSGRTLVRMDKTIQQDVGSLLTYLEQPDHSAVLVGLVRAVRELAQAKSTVSAMRAAMDGLHEVGKPGPDEEGWWSVGLDLLRTLAWDLTAIAAHEAGAAELMEEGLVAAEAVSTRAVGTFVQVVQLPPTLRTLVLLLPPVHRAVPDMLAEGVETKGIALAVARALDGRLDDAMAQLAKSAGQAEGQASVAGLVLDVFQTASEVGLANLLLQPKEALATLADKIELGLKNYPPDAQVFVATMAAVARYGKDPKGAHEVFAQAAKIARKHLPRLSFAPQLVEAWLMLDEEDHTAEILELVDQALAEGEKTLACGQAHPVHALVPFRMWALEVQGDTDGARRAYLVFKKLTDDGFAGDAAISCVLRSFSAHFIFNINLGNSVCGFALPGKQEGTFQIGAGSQSGAEIPRTGDEVVCDVSEPAGPRVDRIMEAHLAWAVYSLLRGEDAEAHRALMDAARWARIMVRGSAVTLGTWKAGQLRKSAEALDLNLLGYAALLARVKGHWQSADILEQVGDTVAAYRDGGWLGALPEDDAVPVFLEEFDQLTSMGPLLRAWVQPQTEDSAKELVDRIRVWAEQSGVATDWGVALARDSLLGKLEGQLGKQLRDAKLVPPASGPGKAAIDLRNMLLEAGVSQQLPAEAHFDQVLRALAEHGMVGEMIAPTSKMALYAKYKGQADVAMRLIETALKYVTPEASELLNADLLMLAAEILMEVQQHETALAALLRSIPVLAGSIDPQLELNHRWNLVRYLGSGGLIEQFRLQLDTLLPILSRGYGNRNALYFSLLAVRTAMELLNADVSLTPVRALVTHGSLVQEAEPSVNFLTLLLASPDYPDRKRLASDFLAYVFQSGPEPQAKPAADAEGGE